MVDHEGDDDARDSEREGDRAEQKRQDQRRVTGHDEPSKEANEEPADQAENPDTDFAYGVAVRWVFPAEAVPAEGGCSGVTRDAGSDG